MEDIRHPDEDIRKFLKGSPISSKGGRTKYKRQKQTKDLGTETHLGEGVMKKKFPHSRKPSHGRVHGEFWNLRGQHNQEGKNKTKQNNSPQNMCLTATTSEDQEVAPMFASATSECGLGREVRAAS